MRSFSAGECQKTKSLGWVAEGAVIFAGPYGDTKVSIFTFLHPI